MDFAFPPVFGHAWVDLKPRMDMLSSYHEHLHPLNGMASASYKTTLAGKHCPDSIFMHTGPAHNLQRLSVPRLPGNMFQWDLLVQISAMYWNYTRLCWPNQERDDRNQERDVLRGGVMHIGSVST
eukprot:1158351-Pelagomonas_calceolata.AAC.3